MLLGDVQTRVKEQFGDTAGAMITSDDIARWATDAQLDIVRRTKLLESVTVLPSAANTSQYTVPNVFEIRRITYNGLLIKMTPRSELDDRFPGRGVAGYGTATPTSWYATQTGFVVFPVPGDNTGIMIINHTKRPNPVVNPGDAFEIAEQYHEDIVRRCMERAYETDGQWNAADRMRADVKDRQNEAAHDRVAGAGDSYPAVRALPGDGGDYY